MIVIKNKTTIEKMRTAGRLLAEIMEKTKKIVVPGNTTLKIDDFIEKHMVAVGLKPECKGYAKKSIAGFKLRKGMAIGIAVTLRRKQMYEFLDKFINIALPGVRDFRGLNTKLDGNGNYNVGIKDWMVFPEVDYDKVDKIRGLNVAIKTTAKSDEHALALLKSFKMPFQKR